jgi:hypothetical protein
MNTLNNENIIYVPNTLDGENIVSSHLEENALLIDGTNQMLANLNAGNYRLTHVSSAISANDAVNKSQLDLKSDTSYVDGNFLNKTTATAQIVNSNLDMNTKRIYNLSNPLTQTDAVNLSYLGTNYLNKTTTANSTIAAKVSFTNFTTDIVSNPVITMFNTVGGGGNGNFLRFQKGVVETSNTQIGGLSACDKNIGNTLIRVADLIFSRGINGEARMDLQMIDGNRNPLRITDGEFISRNNNQTFLKQDLTNLLNYTSVSDKWTMYKELDMNTTNKIINVASPTDNGDAVNKQFLDTNFLNKVTGTTQIVNSNLDMNTTNKIINVATPTDNGDAVNKQFLDTNFLNKVTGNTQIVNSNLDMNTTNKIINVASPTDNGDAVNKEFLDTNFFNKTTATAQIVNSNLDMNTKRIYNLSNPATQTDAVNLSYLGTNYLNKTTTANSTIAAKVSFTNQTTDIIGNPVITMFNTVGGGGNGNFLRFQKGVVETSNTQIGGLSACDKNIGNTLIRVADLIFSRGTSGEARMDLEVINGNRNPLTITDGEFISRNNSHYFLKQDGTNLLNYTSVSDKWTMYKELDMNNNITINSVATFNGTTNFNDDILVSGNNKLSFNNDDLSSDNGMSIRHNGSVAFMDVRANEFRVRTSSTETPDTIRFKINDTNTSVINNFFVNANTTLGDNVATDTTTFNSIANFPSGSELKFNSGSTLLLQSGSTTTFASGSNTGIEDGANLQFKSNSSSYYLAGAWLEYACVQSFLAGSYIDSARVRLIPSGNSNIQLSNLSVENGMYCNNTSKITITMPNKNVYFNNRHYIIKVLAEDVDIDPPTGVTIDNSTNTIGVGGNYRSYQFAFTSDFSTTGKIYIIGDK